VNKEDFLYGTTTKYATASMEDNYKGEKQKFNMSVILFTWSRKSGSDADASHLLFRINMFGFERRVETLWKKAFSCNQHEKFVSHCGGREVSVRSGTYGDHESAFGVRDEHEHVSVQAMLVYPLVEALGHVDSRGIHQDHIVSEQLTLLLRPEDADQRTLA